MPALANLNCQREALVRISSGNRRRWAAGASRSSDGDVSPAPSRLNQRDVRALDDDGALFDAAFLMGRAVRFSPGAAARIGGAGLSPPSTRGFAILTAFGFRAASPTPADARFARGRAVGFHGAFDERGRPRLFGTWPLQAVGSRYPGASRKHVMVASSEYRNLGGAVAVALDQLPQG